MSDASTGLADQPAGRTRTLRRPSRRGVGGGGRGRTDRTGDNRRGPVRWQSRLWDSTPTSALLDEAGRLIDRRDWRRATRILAVAATTTADLDDRRHILRTLAVTSADGGLHRVSSEAMFDLQAMEPRDADTWVAFANVALARGNYGHADAAARSALAHVPDHSGAWVALAAGYCGLGWFDQADSCLDRLDRHTLTDLERWRIGRAVNRWSLGRSHWLSAALLSAVVVGVLAVAVAVSVPFLAREARLRRMRTAEPTGTFEDLATVAWKYERRLRVGHAAAVVASVGGFLAAVLVL